MIDSVNERAVVLDLLLLVNKDGEQLHKVLNGALERFEYLDKSARSFISRLTRGTIEKQITLDYYLNQISKTPMKDCKPVIRELLRMSAYQILYMEQVPNHAAINEAVKLAAEKSFGTLKGFVNGVLRNLERNQDTLALPKREKSVKRYLSVVYSVPAWIVGEFLAQFGEEKTEDVLKAFSMENMTYIRVNTAKITPGSLKTRLEAEGVTVRHKEGWPEYTFALSQYDYLAGIESFQDGLFYVQDLSSALAGVESGIKPGDTVLDVCSAPGGKAINAALLAGEHGTVIARDLSEDKVMMIEDNMFRLGLDNIRTEVQDACVFCDSDCEKYDVVLADLPCSGLGDLGRKPDVRYRVTKEDVESLAALQAEILKNACQYVKSGGTLVYSTCTLTRPENTLNTENFLNEHPDFIKVKEQTLLPGEASDGFYYCRMQRKD